MWNFADPPIVAAVAVTAVLASYQAILTSRTPQGAVGWVVFILALPLIGVPIYLLLGYANYGGFAEARQAGGAPKHRVYPGGDHPSGGASPDDRLAAFARLAGMPAERGNGIDLLIDGDATFDALLTAIASAERYVLLQFYRIRDDAAGRRVKAALIERARAGVRVHLLHDSFRGVGLPRRYAGDLRAAGVEIRAPRGPRRVLGRLQINSRSHRKLVVVDGDTGFLGGLNIGEEYLGLDPTFGRWRDTFARVRGPMVAQLQCSFAADWRWSSGVDLHDRLNWRPPPDPRDMRGLILSPAPTDPLETGNLYFCALAGAARRRLWIATPYFVPDTAVMAALKLAALRGVEVRVLLPDMADHHLPWAAAFAYFDGFRRAGGEIWRYEEGFLHQKVALVDDDLISVGTINLDIRSGLLNFEQTAIVEDHAAAAAVARMLEDDFARSRRMETWLHERPVWRRVSAQVARLLAPLL